MNTFRPVAVRRGPDGFWLHPAAAAALSRDREEDLRRLPEARALRLAFVEFFDDAPPALRDRYDQGTRTGGRAADWQSAVRDWQPTPPPGDGWFLLGLYDTSSKTNTINGLGNYVFLGGAIERHFRPIRA